MAAGLIGCGDDGPQPNVQTRAPSARTATEQSSRRPEGIPADRAGSDRAQVRAVLEHHHEAFLAGDDDAYCAALAEELRRSLNCEPITQDGLAYQRSNGLVVENPEILELTLEGEKAYAAVYEQNAEQPGEKTPTDYELTKNDRVWRISRSKYRTEREDGPANCFVGGLDEDLC